MRSIRLLTALLCGFLYSSLACGQDIANYTFSCQVMPEEKGNIFLEAQSDLPDNTVFVILIKSGDTYVDRGARTLQKGTFRWANEVPLPASSYDVEVLFQSSYQTDPEVLKILGGISGDKMGTVQGMEDMTGSPGINKIYSQKISVGSQDDMENEAKQFSKDMATLLRNYAEAYATSKKNYWGQLPNKGTPALIPEEEWGKRRVENFTQHFIGVQEILKDWIKKASLPAQKQVLAAIETKISTYISAIDAIYYLDLKGEDILPAVPYREYYKEHTLTIRFIERQIESSFEEIMETLNLSGGEKEGILTPLAEADVEKRNVLSSLQQGAPESAAPSAQE